MGLRFSALMIGTAWPVSLFARTIQPPKSKTLKLLAGPIKSTNKQQTLGQTRSRTQSHQGPMARRFKMIVRDMMTCNTRLIAKCKVVLLAGIFAICVATAHLSAQAAKPSNPAAPVNKPTRYRPNRMPAQALVFYDAVWGIDSLSVKTVESGELVRFSYQVLDGAKAKPLNDEKSEPSLIDPKAGVKLLVPSMEKVGKLRQVSAPQVGRMYWMAFSNKGRLVKPGDRVNVVIGDFHANGLVVE